MCLFLKTIGQNNKAVTFNKTEKSKYIAAYLHSYFPYIVCIHKLCEILRRHGIEVSYQFQHPQYFFVWASESVSIKSSTGETPATVLLKSIRLILLKLTY